MSSDKQIRLGADVATGSFGLGARDAEGKEFYASTPMTGGVTWHEQPAFDLTQTPEMLSKVLDELQGKGVAFKRGAGTLSFSVRQHDMVLLDKNLEVLIPALSWQCNAAKEQVRVLRENKAEAQVGRVEERFILPKLMWALEVEPSLRDNLHLVMTTGDWIAYMLTGAARLSTSDALSNGLLAQKTKRLATVVLQKAGLDPKWFPKVIQSGHRVGKVKSTKLTGKNEIWNPLRKQLAGWRVAAGLGDNHATAVGCGLKDHKSIVVSAGNSGTVNRACAAQVKLAGDAACFEYYQDRMLLMMLADCCQWYDRFVGQLPAESRAPLDALNEQALQANPAAIRRVLHGDHRETYPPNWDTLTVGEQVASTQFSIMLELLFLVKAMLKEVKDPTEPIQQFVLTGGLSQSPYFQQVFAVGIELLAPGTEVSISNRTGPMRFQTAAYGALINSELPDPNIELNSLLAERCGTMPCEKPDDSRRGHLEYLLRSYGL